MTKKSMPIKELAELYYGDEKASLRELAAIEGVHKTTIKRRLERNGYKVRKIGRMKGRKSKLPLSLKEKAESMKYMYGMTFNDYDKMYKEQLGGCAICGKGIPSTWKTGVHIDHDHKTGKVRGLLCPNCNRGLGLFKENTNTLLSACEYLNRH